MKDLNCLAGLGHVRQCYCAQSPFTLKKKIIKKFLRGKATIALFAKTVLFTFGQH